MKHENKLKLLSKLSRTAISARAAVICENENIKHRETRISWIKKGVVIVEYEKDFLSISIKDKNGDVHFINTCRHNEVTEQLNLCCKMLDILY